MLTEEEMYITFKNEVEGSGQISQEQMKQELRTNSVLHPALQRGIASTVLCSCSH